MASRKRNPEGSIDRGIIERLMFGTGTVRRFTQDAPVLPDVWIEYAKSSEERVRPESHVADEPYPPIRLLLTPFREISPGKVAADLRQRLQRERRSQQWRRFGHRPDALARIVCNQTTVAATLYFEDLIRVVLPMTAWWRGVTRKWNIEDLSARATQLSEALVDPENASQIERLKRVGELLPPDVLWLLRVVGALAIVRKRGELPPPFNDRRKIGYAKPSDWKLLVAEVYDAVQGVSSYDGEAVIFSLSLNRAATPTIARSTLAIKADAARLLFSINCNKLRWAIVDTGVQADHPAFRKPSGGSRVEATYDFTGLDLLLDPDTKDLPTRIKKRLRSRTRVAAVRGQLATLNASLRSGKSIDWQLLEPFLRVEPTDGDYFPPHDHGTHVAGILGANWRKEDSGAPDDLRGVCPDILLYDLRVLNGRGQGDEFSVMAALQFIRYLNTTSEYMIIHGVNLSLSIPHDISNYACGRTPICNESERLVASGVVVVAAAGNQGYRRYATDDGSTEAYNSISITDPGNAEAVITVGATHRFRPHTYGVSYFSSRGPTGDGRSKPDLVAPGEKITAPLPSDAYGIKDGTSMAAPHVSGAAALLMARHSELIGEPERIKKILMTTATDLGRERYFQGSGMLDVLRALQSV